jgi:two-component system response regulator AlgR
MKILIADDERLARERLRALLEEIGMSESVMEARNGREAVNIATTFHPALVFLDIRMPGMDGMEAAKELTQLHLKPIIIFTTAYGEHALEAFEHQAVDYLLKPIKKERLEQAIKRACTLMPADTGASVPTVTNARSHITAYVRGELCPIPVNEIYFFSADEKYVLLRWKHGNVLVTETLKDLEKEFAGQFLRIHRSRLIAMVHIASLTRDGKGHYYIKLKELAEQLEISRRHLPNVRKILKDMRISGA